MPAPIGTTLSFLKKNPRAVMGTLGAVQGSLIGSSVSSDNNKGTGFLLGASAGAVAGVLGGEKFSRYILNNGKNVGKVPEVAKEVGKVPEVAKEVGKVPEVVQPSVQKLLSAPSPRDRSGAFRMGPSTEPAQASAQKLLPEATPLRQLDRRKLTDAQERAAVKDEVTYAGDKVLKQNYDATSAAKGKVRAEERSKSRQIMDNIKGTSSPEARARAFQDANPQFKPDLQIYTTGVDEYRPSFMQKVKNFFTRDRNAIEENIVNPRVESSIKNTQQVVKDQQLARGRGKGWTAEKVKAEREGVQNALNEENAKFNRGNLKEKDIKDTYRITNKEQISQKKQQVEDAYNSSSISPKDKQKQMDDMWGTHELHNDMNKKLDTELTNFQVEKGFGAMKLEKAQQRATNFEHEKFLKDKSIKQQFDINTRATGDARKRSRKIESQRIYNGIMFKGGSEKLASKAHYYLPGAVIGAIGGSQFKDYDPATGQAYTNPINVGLGAALGLAGGHVVGTKLPKYFLNKAMLERENISRDKIYNIFKDTFDKVTKNSPRSVDNYYQNNLVVAPPTPHTMNKAVSEMFGRVKKHTDIMSKPLNFATKEDVNKFVEDELTHSRLAPILEQEINKQFQNLRKGVQNEYMSQMIDMSSTRPDRMFKRIRNRFERGSAQRDLSSFMSQVANELPNTTREALYVK